MSGSPGFGTDRRLAGVGLTALVHLALIVGWQMARQAPQAVPDGLQPAIQWLLLPAPAPRTEPPAVVPPPPPPAPAAGRAAPRF